MRKKAVRIGIIIAAGGSSRRYGAQDKLLQNVGGLPLFLHSVRNFAPCCEPGALVLPVRQEALEEYRSLAAKYLPEYPDIRFVPGGSSRSGSVRNALAALPCEKCDVIAIHDAARPLAAAELLLELASLARQYGGAIAAKPETDSLKRTADGETIAAPVDRSTLWCAETPQVFDREKLLDAYRRIPGEFTDDAEVMRQAGYPVRLYHHKELNPKLTTPGDLALLEALFALRGKQQETLA